eukprot:CAMPEP_0183443614 /NCGR_PEP_ID=MMETSP0370-20130417/92390_1 /TAXON_ID=268820 /ORGANISM="Peridinium aciculiferum, Strain PAER-2" /LENGTH=101 /DNA_ID=CAMNT_0025633671 /DNA_START=103 /DNA_END=408 /DNA_ORIENTATION=+
MHVPGLIACPRDWGKAWQAESLATSTAVATRHWSSGGIFSTSRDPMPPSIPSAQVPAAMAPSPAPLRPPPAVLAGAEDGLPELPCNGAAPTASTRPSNWAQ